MNLPDLHQVSNLLQTIIQPVTYSDILTQLPSPSIRQQPSPMATSSISYQPQSNSTNSRQSNISSPSIPSRAATNQLTSRSVTSTPTNVRVKDQFPIQIESKNFDDFHHLLLA